MRERGVLAFLLALLAAGPAAADGVPAPRREALLYMLHQDCGSCHGLRLTGGIGPPITSAALAAQRVADVEAVILHGRPGTPMPPWAGILSAADARFLAEALKDGEGERR